MITNTTPTYKTNFYGDGKSFPAQYGDPGEPVINTETIGYWGDGQAFLYPFQNTQSGGGVTMPMQIQIIKMTMIL